MKVRKILDTIYHGFYEIYSYDEDFDAIEDIKREEP